MSARTEFDPKQWAEAARWLARVDEDIAAVETLVKASSVSIGPAALHCQQAAEKTAKAVPIALNVEPPRIHDVGRLGKLISPHFAEIGRAIIEMGELTTWYVSARYPDAMESLPSEEDIPSQLGRLRQLRQLIAALAPTE
jgi:HEPN domain-containing protein